jgi:hypothetical protein
MWNVSVINPSEASAAGGPEPFPSPTTRSIRPKVSA